MGMKEDRLNWAAMMETHSKRMFDATANPYYVISAIAAARTAEWKVPDWALNFMLDAIKRAYWSSYSSSKFVSIDAELGIKTKQGGTPKKLRAYRDSEEVIVFDDIQILHKCFDISVPEACELVYFEIDHSFARQMQESMHSEIVFDEAYEKRGITKKLIDDLNCSGMERNRAYIASPLHTDAVREKLKTGKWLEITTGERLGYGLEHLIERYHRLGAKLAAAGQARYTDEIATLSLHASGSILLNSACCRYSVLGDAQEEQSGKRPLARLKPRQEFAAFHAKMAETSSFRPVT
jgi:hypothetical protein